MSGFSLDRSVTVEGIGLHTGVSSSVLLCPASPGSGIVFAFPGGQEISADARNVVDTRRATVLGHSSATARLSTVEHLLSACAGLGILDLRVETSGPELPIGDGSAGFWCDALVSAGGAGEIRFGPSLAEPIEIFGKGGSFVAAYPAEKFTITVAIHFDHPMVETQLARFIEGDDFASAIAPARTFGFQEEVDALLKSGLALGGTLENALVIRPDRFSLPLRFDNELARHKLLDLIGDLSLAGNLPRAQIVANKPGHAINHEMARAIVASRTMAGPNDGRI